MAKTIPELAAIATISLALLTGMAACSKTSVELPLNEKVQLIDKEETWPSDLKAIIQSTQSVNDKYLATVELAKHSSVTMATIEQMKIDISHDYLGSTILTDIKDDKVMLTKIFNGAVMQKVIDEEHQMHTYAKSYTQLLYQLYIGEETLDSPYITEQMKILGNSVEAFLEK